MEIKLRTERFLNARQCQSILKTVITILPLIIVGCKFLVCRGHILHFLLMVQVGVTSQSWSLVYD